MNFNFNQPMPYPMAGSSGSVSQPQANKPPIYANTYSPKPSIPTYGQFGSSSQDINPYMLQSILGLRPQGFNSQYSTMPMSPYRMPSFSNYNFNPTLTSPMSNNVGGYVNQYGMPINSNRFPGRY